jgi:curli production assembly/transport component CsgF
MRPGPFCRHAALLCGALAALPAAATDLIYRPLNPSFGGDPLNGQWLLNSANAQNNYKDPQATASPSGFGNQSSVQVFTETLQRAILSRIASAVSGSVVDANGKLVPGTVSIGSISVTVADLGTTLRITTLDTSSGQTTVFEIPK